MRSRWSLVLVALVAAVVGVACGDNPASPSGGAGVVVRGVMLSEGASVSASSGPGVSNASSPITVRVEGAPSLTTKVNGNGTFFLEGVPGGEFTLVFERDGVEIGRVVINAQPGAEVKIIVQLQQARVVVIEIDVDDANAGTPSANCMISGGTTGKGIELEGKVAQVVTPPPSLTFQMTTQGGRASGLIDVNAASAALRCLGNTGGSDCAAAVATGAQVHVRGTLMTCTTTAAQVTATEVKVQKN